MEGRTPGRVRVNEFRWHPDIISPRKLCRRITRDPFAEATLYKNAQDEKTFVANIQNHGSMDSWGSWPSIGRIKFGFKRRKDAMAWADQEIPKVKKLLAEARQKGALSKGLTV